MTISLLWWGLILIAQNAMFTWVSRARNSGSDWYHAVAAVFSNGVWFLAFYFTFGFLNQIHTTNSVLFAVLVGGTYIACTVTGSVMGGKLLRKYFERGNRRAGHGANEERMVVIEQKLATMAEIMARSIGRAEEMYVHVQEILVAQNRINKAQINLTEEAVLVNRRESEEAEV